jgi:hypothetical protein
MPCVPERGLIEESLVKRPVQQQCVQNYRRDATLAAAVLSVLVGLLAWRGRLDALLGPIPAVVGVAGALAIEAAFLTVPTVARAWDRPAIQVAGTLAVLAGALVAFSVAGAAAVAAVCWGLLAYFGLLAVALARGRV